MTAHNAKNCCEICNGKGDKWPVECHETWSYNNNHLAQTLKGLISLRPNCHGAKHKAGVSEEIIAEFARISPIAWVHIAFTGKYNFKKSIGVIDIAAFAHEIEKHIKQHFWKSA